MNPAQAIQNEAIAASAGSGKTFQLAVRYIRLLANGIKPQRIIAMTFTNKAAGEILQKIIKILVDWIKDHERFRKDAAVFGLEHVNHEELVRMLRQLAMSVHLLNISTLDSFFFNIINSFPFEFGLSGRISLMSEEDPNLRQEIIREILWKYSGKEQRTQFLEDFKRASYGDDEKSLSSKMEDFVKNYHSCLLKVPDAHKWGEGNRIFKSLPITLDSKDLRLKLDEFSSQFGSLTEKQANALEEFEKLALRPDMPKAPLYLFNLLCEKMPPVDMDIEIQVQRKALFFSRHAVSLARELINHIIGYLIERNLDATKAIYRILSMYEEDYNRDIRENGLLSFQDITWLLSKGGEAGYTLSQSSDCIRENRLYIDYRLDSKFDHWLLDEFQDTSDEQWKVIENLIDELMQYQNGERSFFYVGDVKQSIYQWRSGNPRLFGQIREKYGIESRPLEKSYRSSAEVIYSVNKVFENLNKLDSIDQETIQRLDWQHHKHIKDSPGYVCVIEIPRFQNAEDGRIYKAKLMEKLLSDLNPFDAEKGRRLETAVLGRNNKFLRETVTYLRENYSSLAYELSLDGKIELCADMISAAAISMIRLAAHPGDRFSLEHLKMLRLSEHIKDKNFIANSGLAKLESEGNADCFCAYAQELIRNSGLSALTEIIAEALSAIPGKMHKTRLAALHKLAADESSQGVCDIDRFIMKAEEASIDSASAANTVQFMTIHKSKGLDFDIVILPDLKSSTGISKADVQGLQIHKDENFDPEWCFKMPKKDMAEKVPELAAFIEEKNKEYLYENLCLLYVALTRAKRAVYIFVEAEGKTKSESLYPTDIIRTTLEGESSLEALKWQKQIFSGISNEEGELKTDLLYSKGNPDWHKEQNIKIQTPIYEDHKELLQLSFHNILSRTTPSANEGGRVKGSHLFKAGSRARETGNAVHEILAMSDWIEQDRLEENLEKWLSGKGRKYSEECRQETASLYRKCFAQEEISKRFARPEKPMEVWREKAFDIIINKTWISGKFDRVEIERDSSGKISSLVITEYKTDKTDMSEESLELIKEKYSRQIDSYRKVVSRMLNYPEKQIKVEILLLRTSSLISF